MMDHFSVLNKEEEKMLMDIGNIYYIKPIVENIDQYISDVGLPDTFNQIHTILRISQSSVEKLLDDRKTRGEIKDIGQARKSIVGNAFSNSIIYLFLKCKEKLIIRNNIFITNKTNKPIFKELVSITVDGETQKPDMDLIIYNTDDQGKLNKSIIISLKTSLKERAGQTYKWKLLMEIATTENPIREKYQIRYNVKQMPLICFVTVNFYNEINNPQHRGMFKFFDHSFIGKPLNADFISNLSELINYANQELG